MPRGSGADSRVSPVPARSGDEFDAAVLFAPKLNSLTRLFTEALPDRAGAETILLAWPKKASRVTTDITFDPAQKLGLDAGLPDNKSGAIDDTWSGLRFVRRIRPAHFGKRSG